MDKSEDGFIIDHVSKDKCDNRCINLQYDTVSGNSHKYL